MFSPIDWNKFLESQKKLDDYTFKVKGLTYETTSFERSLALSVELLEFANATKVFKYWSVQKSDRATVLDEYADVFHFILATFIEKNIDPSDISYPNNSAKGNKELTCRFLDLISMYGKNMDSDYFKEWVKKFLELGSCLGFTLSDLDEAYWKKWNVNIERQRSGY